MACSEEQFGLHTAAEVACPDASKLGQVEVTTPLLTHPLVGGVFLAQQGNLPGNGSNPFGSLLALYMQLQRPLLGRAGEARRGSQTGSGDRPAGDDVPEQPAGAVRQPEAELLRRAARGAREPAAVRHLHDRDRDDAVVRRRVGLAVVELCDRPPAPAARRARPPSRSAPASCRARRATRPAGSRRSA